MNKNEKEIHYLFELYKNAKNKEEREQCYYNIYRKYNKLVKRIAFSIIKNEHDSEDIVQNVFIKIYNIILTFINISTFITIILKLAS